jgi:hypothetical protein
MSELFISLKIELKWLLGMSYEYASKNGKNFYNE